MAKSGKRFEALVHEIYSGICLQYPDANVKLDEKIEGPEGLRQFDVTIRHQMAGIEYLTVVECKDHKRPVGVEYVEELDSKRRDVHAAKAILVSSVGFQRSAIAKAKRIGIDLCLVGEKNKIFQSTAASIPVYIHRIIIEKYFICERIGHLRAGTPRRPVTIFPKKINGIDLLDVIFDGVKSDKFRRLLPGEDLFEWQIDRNFIGALNLNEYFGSNEQIFTLDDGKMEIHQNVTLALDYKREWYFGYANNIKSAKSLINLTQNKIFMTADLDDFDRFVINLNRCDNSGAVPFPGRESAIAFDVIDMRLTETRLYEKLAPGRA